MNFLNDIYKNNLFENERNIKFWEEYLQSLTSLDFNNYLDKLNLPVLVPIGNKILFRGILKHTNEVTVALGADYFTKCSVKQAEVLRQHRLKDAKSKLLVLHKEKEYLESQITFNREIFDGFSGQDILEVCSEDEDKVWREKHKEKVKQYYQNKKRNQIVTKAVLTDDELWSRLEELELQEELENELDDVNNTEELVDKKIEFDSFIIKENDVNNIQTGADRNDEVGVGKITHYVPKQTSKQDLLKQVIGRQKMLEEKLAEFKNRERVQSKTESDLLSRLDEMEQLDELEDEMDRLDDIIQDDESDSVTNEDNSTKITRRVSFADQEDSDTIDINFVHSNIEPSKKPYNPEKGIIKPNDLYEAYPNFINNETTSILKKSKYDNIAIDTLPFKKNTTDISQYDNGYDNTIVVKDIIEKSDNIESKIQNDSRPISLFKKKRQQKS